MKTRSPKHQARFRKTEQVCALAERVVSAALQCADHPALYTLRVERVLPAPTVARLLIVVTPDPTNDADVDTILAALDQVRGYLRGELASELNRKRAPELSFTMVPQASAQPLDFAPPDDGSDGQAPPSKPPIEGNDTVEGADLEAAPGTVPEVAAPFSQHVVPKAPKREKPRNQRRTARREAKLRARRARTAPATQDMGSLYELTHPEGGIPIRRWTRGVPVEEAALKQLSNIAKLSIVGPFVAAMPDVHLGIGATVGSVIPTQKAIIPAAVGVDIGCGMMATRTTLTASNLPETLRQLRDAIERAVPHGRGKHGGRGDRGSWQGLPDRVGQAWKALETDFKRICEKHPAIERSHHAIHLGTLGTGNHFIELCLDGAEQVWVMLHSGSRGVGNRIGRHFIELARKDMQRHISALPDKDLAYFSEGSEHFDDYVEAVDWAQRFAAKNRELMMTAVLRVLREAKSLPSFQTDKQAINCHHNYVARETHHGRDLWVTRKGAVRAGKDELGIIPGSMGARSYIVRGKGNPESLCSCSHGAGRRMSRSEAKRRFSVDDHVRMTHGVECRKDKSVIDETPAAYKDIDSVMAAQADLVSVEHTLKQVLCVKG